MPSPKKVRAYYLKLKRTHDRLQYALNAAHSVGLIVYADYKAESPCKTNWETWERIEATTEKQLAKAMREEIGS